MNRFLKFFVSALLFSTIFLPIKAQGDFWHIPSRDSFRTDREDALLFSIESSHFFLNNEYFGSLVEGYTLPGHILEPSFTYYAGSRLRFKGGASMVKFYGDNEQLNVRPVLSAQLRFTDKLDLILGTLNGNNNHSLSDAMYHFEREIFHPVENGLQIKYNSENLWVDIWINWQQYIRGGDSIPEVFTAGVSVRKKMLNSPSGWSVVAPLALLAWHEGGQISNYLTPSHSPVNLSAGLEIEKVLPGKINRIGWFGNAMYYRDLKDSNLSGLHKGHGFYTGVTAASAQSKLLLSYWGARNFVAPLGNPVYGSASVIDGSSEVFSSRQMMVGKYQWHKTFSPHIGFSFLFEGFYDLSEGWFDYGMGVMLRFSPEFFIARLPMAQW